MAKSLKQIVLRTLVVVLVFSVIASCAFSLFDLKASAASSTISNNGYYYIRNYYTGKYMTVSGSSSGANVYQSKFTGTTYQRFKLSLVSGSGSSAYYNIIPSVNTSLRFDVDNMSTANGTNLKIFAQSSAYPNAQQFKFISNGDGTYRIVPKCCASSSPNEVIEVAGPSIADGTNIQIWDWVNGVGQKWILESTTDTYRNMCWDLPFNDTVSSGSVLVTDTAGHAYYDLDFDVDYGESLYCTAPATVVDKGENDSMGYYVIVEYDKPYNGKTLTARYLHLKEMASVSVNQHITHYNLMGYVGNTGTVYPEPTTSDPYAGTHLHLDINTEGQYWGNYLTTSNTIPPQNFFPEANFTWY